MKPDVSIIIPCYNEAGLLERSVAEVREVMEGTRYQYELIFVDDASRDGTPDLIRKICDRWAGCHHILHEENQGRGGAVTAGIKAAKGSIAGFLDIDLEVHARYIPSLVQAIQKGPWGAAIVSRVYRTEFNPNCVLRTILSIGYRRIVRSVFELPFSDTETGFKFFDRAKILPVLDQTEEKGWFWDTEIMTLAHRHGLSVLEIPGLFQRRTDKQSSVKVVGDTLAYVRALRRFRRRLRAA
jgi:glycosyltransferase AglD